MSLTAQQVATFEEHGVLIAEGVLSDADLQPTIDAVTDFVNRRALTLQAQGKLEELHEDEPFERRYAKLRAQSAEIGHGIDINRMRAPALFDFLRNDHLLDAVASLIGSEITCSPIQHLRDKPPNRLTEPNFYYDTPWHQDSGVTWAEADAVRIVTCWIPLVNATRDRGCIQVMPDVFENGHLHHQAEGGTTIRPDLLPQVEPLVAEVDKGGVIFMSQFTPHRSRPNVTEWDVRWSLDLRYQQSGTPTGRPFHPDFPVRSPSDPGSVLTDHASWCKLWDEALEQMHQHPPARGPHRV